MVFALEAHFILDFWMEGNKVFRRVPIANCALQSFLGSAIASNDVLLLLSMTTCSESLNIKWYLIDLLSVIYNEIKF